MTACDQCRVLKVKCVKTNDDTKCSKFVSRTCAKSERTCTVSERRQPRKPPARQARLVDLDGRLQGILDHLTQKDHIGSTPAEEDHARSSSTDGSHTFRSQTGTSTASTDATPATEGSSQTEDQEAPSTAALPVSNHWMDRLALDHHLVNYLLGRFRAMQHYFPFVVVPAGWTTTSMLESHSSLLLAAVTAASAYYPRLQQALAEEFHAFISREVLKIDGAKLDLLEGILVYLAWAQYHMAPRSRQAHKILHIAIGILADLGLDGNPAPFLRKRGDVYLLNAGNTPNDNDSVEMRTEASRASLGCFYLSGIIPPLTGNPNAMNPLPIEAVAIERARKLSKTAEQESDSLLLPLIEYEHLLENVRAAYRNHPTTTSGATLSATIQLMTTKLNSWRSAIPDELWYQDLFANRYHYAKVRINEMGLLYRFEQRSLMTAESCLEPNIITANFALCVDAAKQHLDSFLALSSSEYEILPMEEWCRMMMTLFALYKLSVGLKNMPEWDVNECRQRIDLEAYLGHIISRLRPSNHIEVEDVSDDLYHVIPELLESVKASYIISRDWPGSVTPGARVHMDMAKPFHQAKSENNHIGGVLSGSAVRTGCPAFRFWNTQGLAGHAESGWHDVKPAAALSPEEQLAKNDRLWSDLTSIHGSDDS